MLQNDLDRKQNHALQLLSKKFNATTKIKRGQSERTLLRPLHFIAISSESGQAAVALSSDWRGPLCSLAGLSESPRETESIDENRSISPPFHGLAKCSFCLGLLSRGAEQADCQGPHLGASGKGMGVGIELSDCCDYSCLDFLSHYQSQS